MATKILTKNSGGKVQKARPSKKAGAIEQRPGKRIPAVIRTNAPEDNAPEDNAPKDNVSGDNVSGDNASGDNAPGVPMHAKTKAEAMKISSTAAFELWVILTDFSDKPEGQMTPLEKMEMADRGVTKKNLESLKEKTKLDYDELAKLLSVGRATLINKKGNDKFSPALSEKIVGLADLYSYGYEVFEDNERFNQWMLRPNRALGGKPPYDLIHNQFGREEVRNVIGRIEYGVYS